MRFLKRSGILIALVLSAGVALAQEGPATPKPEIPDPGVTRPEPPPPPPRTPEPPLAIISPALGDITTPDGKPHPASGKSPLAEALTRAEQKFRDLTRPARTGRLDLADVKALVIASTAFSDKTIAAALRNARSRIECFVRDGGIIVAFTADARTLDFLPASMSASIECVGHLKREAALPGHPLLAGGLKPTDLGGRHGTLYAGGCYGSCKGLSAVVAFDARGRFPVVLEGTLGKGRVMLFHLAPDRAQLVGSDTDKVSATLIFEHLTRCLQAAMAGKAPVITTAERTLTGVVFLDANGNGSRDAGEATVGGVPVSDGARIVTTDPGGRYALHPDVYSRFVWTVGDVARFRGPFWREIPKDTPRLDLGLVPRKTPLTGSVRIAHLTDVGAVLPAEAETDPELVTMLSEVEDIARPAGLVVLSTDARFGALRRNVMSKTSPDRPWLAAFVPTEDGDEAVEERDRFNDVFGPERFLVTANGMAMLFEAPTLLEAREAAWREDILKTVGSKPLVVFRPDTSQSESALNVRIAAAFTPDGSRVEMTHGTPSFRIGGIDSPVGFRMIDIDASGNVRTDMRVAGVRRHLRCLYPGGEATVPAGPLRLVLSAYDTSVGDDVKVDLEIAHLTREKARLHLTELKLPTLAPKRVDRFTQVVEFPKDFTVREGFYVIKMTTRGANDEAWHRNVSFAVPKINPPLPVLGTPWETLGGGNRHTGEAADVLSMPLYLFAVTPLENKVTDGSPVLRDGAITVKVPHNHVTGRFVSLIPGMPVRLVRRPYCRHKQGTFTLEDDVIRLKAAEQGASDAAFRFGETPPPEPGRSHLLVGGEFLCVVSETGRAWAFGRTRGAPATDGRYDPKVASSALKWSVEIVPGCRRAVATDSLLFTGNECLDILTGRPRWKLGKYVLRDTNVALTKRHVIVTGVADEPKPTRQVLLALDRVSGRIVWEKELAEVHPNDRVLTAPPAVTKREVYAGTADGTLYALSLDDGEVRWVHQTGPSILPLSARGTARSGRISAQPVVTGEFVIVAGYDGSVTALDTRKGKPVWRWNVGLPIVASPALSGNTLILIDCDGNLYTFVSTRPVKK